MSRSARTGLLLASIALALLGYIVLFDRGSVTSGELDQRKGSALPELVRARVALIEIQRKGALTRLTRDPDRTDEGGLWQVEAPYKAKADQDLINNLLSDLEFIQAKRRLERLSAADRERFGLTRPRYRAWFTQGKLRLPIAIGGESPQGDGVYLQAGDPTRAFVVGKDVLETLEHEPGDFHTKELHDGVLVSTAASLTLRDASGERGAQRTDIDLWELSPPFTGLASAAAVSDVIKAFDGLRAKRFIAPVVADLARYGLEPARFELRLAKKVYLGPAAGPRTGTGGAAAAPKRVEMRLRVGSACEGHQGESYASVDGSRDVSCVLDEDIAKLRKPLSELREARLLPLEDEDLQSIEVKRGAQAIQLTKSGASWSYQTTRSGQTTLQGEARPDSVAAWLKALRDTKFDRFESRSGAGLGTSADVTSLRFERGKDKQAYVVRVLPIAGELRAERGDELLRAPLAPSAPELFEPSAARFRKLSVLQLSEAGLSAIEVKRRDSVERLVRTSGDGGFVLEAPIRAPADALAVGELTRLVCALDAVRFVSDGAQPGVGLDPPELSVVLESTAAGAQPKRSVLRLGAEVVDGRYAALEGEPGVFIAPRQLTTLLAEPLVSRTLLATPLEKLVAIEIAQGARRIRVARSGEGFVADPVAGLDPAEARQLAETVATLRATHATHYGEPDAAESMRDAAASVTVTARGTAPSAAEERYRLRIGGTAQGGGRYVRRDGYAVGFVLPADSVDKLIEPLSRKQ